MGDAALAPSSHHHLSPSSSLLFLFLLLHLAWDVELSQGGPHPTALHVARTTQNFTASESVCAGVGGRLVSMDAENFPRVMGLVADEVGCTSGNVGMYLAADATSSDWFWTNDGSNFYSEAYGCTDVDMCLPVGGVSDDPPGSRVVLRWNVSGWTWARVSEAHEGAAICETAQHYNVAESFFRSVAFPGGIAGVQQAEVECIRLGGRLATIQNATWWGLLVRDTPGLTPGVEYLLGGQYAPAPDQWQWRSGDAFFDTSDSAYHCLVEGLELCPWAPGQPAKTAADEDAFLVLAAVAGAWQWKVAPVLEGESAQNPRAALCEFVDVPRIVQGGSHFCLLRKSTPHSQTFWDAACAADGGFPASVATITTWDQLLLLAALAHPTTEHFLLGGAQLPPEDGDWVWAWGGPANGTTFYSGVTCHSSVCQWAPGQPAIGGTRLGASVEDGKLQWVSYNSDAQFHGIFCQYSSSRLRRPHPRTGYEVRDGGSTWEAAQASCGADGGWLATATDDAAWDRLAQSVSGLTNALIGLTSLAAVGQWRWAEGPAASTNAAPVWFHMSGNEEICLGGCPPSSLQVTLRAQPDQPLAHLMHAGELQDAPNSNMNVIFVCEFLLSVTATPTLSPKPRRRYQLVQTNGSTNLAEVHNSTCEAFSRNSTYANVGNARDWEQALREIEWPVQAQVARVFIAGVRPSSEQDFVWVGGGPYRGTVFAATQSGGGVQGIQPVTGVFSFFDSNATFSGSPNRARVVFFSRDELNWRVLIGDEEDNTIRFTLCELPTSATATPPLTASNAATRSATPSSSLPKSTSVSTSSSSSPSASLSISRIPRETQWGTRTSSSSLTQSRLDLHSPSLSLSIATPTWSLVSPVSTKSRTPTHSNTPRQIDAAISPSSTLSTSRTTAATSASQPPSRSKSESLSRVVLSTVSSRMAVTESATTSLSLARSGGGGGLPAQPPTSTSIGLTTLTRSLFAETIEVPTTTPATLPSQPPEATACLATALAGANLLSAEASSGPGTLDTSAAELRRGLVRWRVFAREDLYHPNHLPFAMPRQRGGPVAALIFPVAVHLQHRRGVAANPGGFAAARVRTALSTPRIHESSTNNGSTSNIPPSVSVQPVLVEDGAPIRFNFTIVLPVLPDYDIADEEVALLSIPVAALVDCTAAVDDGDQGDGDALAGLFTLRVAAPVIPSVARTHAASTAVASTTMIASIGAAPGGAVSDPQALAVVGMMTCAEPYERRMLANYRLLAPTALSESMEGVVLGNLVLVAGVTAVHLALAGVCALGRRLEFADACALCRFPSLSFKVFFITFQGSAFAAAQLLTSPALPPSASNVALATLTLVGITGCVVALPLCAYQWLDTSFFIYDYSRLPLMRHRRVPRWVVSTFFPVGQWMPPHKRRMFAGLFGAQAHPSRILATFPFWSPSVMAMGSMVHPETRAACVAQFATVGVAQLALAVVALALRPFRSYAANVFSAASTLCLALVLAGSASTLRSATTSSVGGAGRAVVVASVQAQMAISLLRVIHALLIFFLERAALSDTPLQHSFSWRSRRGRSKNARSSAGERDGDDAAGDSVSSLLVPMVAMQPELPNGQELDACDGGDIDSILNGPEGSGSGSGTPPETATAALRRAQRAFSAPKVNIDCSGGARPFIRPTANRLSHAHIQRCLAATDIDDEALGQDSERVLRVLRCEVGGGGESRDDDAASGAALAPEPNPQRAATPGESRSEDDGIANGGTPHQAERSDDDRVGPAGSLDSLLDPVAIL